MDLNKILEGIDEAKAKEIREHLDSNYVGLNIAHEDERVRSKVVGKTLGSFETKLKRNAKLIDEDLIKPSEIDELGFDKAFDAAFERLADRQTDLKKRLESKGTPDQEVEKRLQTLETEKQKLLSDYQQTQQQRQTLEEQLKTERETFSQYKVNLVLNTKKQEALKSVNFTDSLQGRARELAIKGFLDDVQNRYKIELDQDDPSGLRIVNKETNQRVAKDNKFLTLGEIYQQEANEAGLLKVSGGGNSKNKRTFETRHKPNDSGQLENKQGIKFKGQTS